jgi:hypothetical protein
MRELYANGEKKGTKTSSFGSPGRINHDSSLFYASKLYEDLPVGNEVEYIENPIPSHAFDKILHKSSEHMDELPDTVFILWLLPLRITLVRIMMKIYLLNSTGIY